jgi:hypothetical protein
VALVALDVLVVLIQLSPSVSRTSLKTVSFARGGGLVEEALVALDALLCVFKAGENARLPTLLLKLATQLLLGVAMRAVSLKTSRTCSNTVRDTARCTEALKKRVTCPHSTAASASASAAYGCGCLLPGA